MRLPRTLRRRIRFVRTGVPLAVARPDPNTTGEWFAVVDPSRRVQLVRLAWRLLCRAGRAKLLPHLPLSRSALSRLAAVGTAAAALVLLGVLLLAFRVIDDQLPPGAGR